MPGWRGPMRVITWNFCAREIILAASVLSIIKKIMDMKLRFCFIGLGATPGEVRRGRGIGCIHSFIALTFYQRFYRMSFLVSYI